MKLLKKILGIMSFVTLMLSGVFLYQNKTFAMPPNYYDNYSKYLLSQQPDEFGRKESVFNLCISPNRSIKDNIRILFYPSNIVVSDCPLAQSGGILWTLLRWIGYVVLFVSIVILAVNLLYAPEKGDNWKKLGMGLLYILYGSLFYFGALRILGGHLLNIEFLSGTKDLATKLATGQNSFFFKFLVFLKGAAFFVAILMLVYYGFQIMSAMDKADKVKKAKTGIVNVFGALVFIKAVDYVFYIAQMPDFGYKAVQIIIQIAKLIGFILGASFVLALFYGGFLLIFGGTQEEMKKVKNIIVGILLAALVIFLFILIVYQLFNEFV